MVDHLNGLYDIAYTIQQAGHYLVHITTAGGQHLGLSPYKLLVEPPSFGWRHMTDGPKFELTAGVRANFMVTSLDKYNQPQPTGGDTIEVRLSRRLRPTWTDQRSCACACSSGHVTGPARPVMN